MKNGFFSTRIYNTHYDLLRFFLSLVGDFPFFTILRLVFDLVEI